MERITKTIEISEDVERDLEYLKDLGSAKTVPFLEEAFEHYLELSGDAGDRLATNYYTLKTIIRLLRSLD